MADQLRSTFGAPRKRRNGENISRRTTDALALLLAISAPGGFSTHRLAQATFRPA